MSAQRGDGWVELQTHDPSDSLLGACRANLYVYQPSGRIDWFALNLQRFLLHARFIFGREPDCDITLNDPAVSGQHAQLSLKEDRLILRDLDSKNGVRVNDEPCEEHLLRHGDVITFGGTDVRFLYGYPKTPRHLTLTFKEGPLRGRRLATLGTSTTLGRAQPALAQHIERTLKYGARDEGFSLIQLPGEGISLNALRLDVYGPRLIYIFNLDHKQQVQLNDARVEGISVAAKGDTLTLGEHTLEIGLLDASALTDAVLLPGGVLLLEEGETPLPEGMMHLEGEAEESLPAKIGDASKQDSDELDFSKAFRSFVHASAEETWADGEGLANTGELALIDAAAVERAASSAPSRWLRWWPLALALLVALIGLSRSIPQRAPLSGQLEAAQRATILAPKAGRVEAQLYTHDQQISSGQALFQISEGVIEAQIKALNLEINTRRAHLTEDQALSPEALAIERAELDALIERLDGLRARRIYTIKAPINGVLAGEPPAQGATISAGQPLAEMIDARALVARVRIPNALLSAPERLTTGRLQVQGTAPEMAMSLSAISKVPDAQGAFFIATPLGRCAPQEGGGTRCEGAQGALQIDSTLRLGQEITVWVERPSISGWTWAWRALFGG